MTSYLTRESGVNAAAAATATAFQRADRSPVDVALGGLSDTATKVALSLEHLAVALFAKETTRTVLQRGKQDLSAFLERTTESFTPLRRSPSDLSVTLQTWSVRDDLEKHWFEACLFWWPFQRRTVTYDAGTRKPSEEVEGPDLVATCVLQFNNQVG